MYIYWNINGNKITVQDLSLISMEFVGVELFKCFSMLRNYEAKLMLPKIESISHSRIRKVSQGQSG